MIAEQKIDCWAVTHEWWDKDAGVLHNYYFDSFDSANLAARWLCEIRILEKEGQLTNEQVEEDFATYTMDCEYCTEYFSVSHEVIVRKVVIT